jgi:hypothetical protein
MHPDYSLFLPPGTGLRPISVQNPRPDQKRPFLMRRPLRPGSTHRVRPSHFLHRQNRLAYSALLLHRLVVLNAQAIYRNRG